MSEQNFKKILGCSPDDFVDYANSIYKMMWEQVLLLALYARQQFIEQEQRWDYPVESKINFENKLKLINLLSAQNSAQNDGHHTALQDSLLDKIERYEDIHSITSYLMNIAAQKEESLSSPAQSLLHDIARHHISFISKDSRTGTHPYSYYAMHTIIKYPLGVFQALLNINFSRNHIHDIFLQAIMKIIRGDGYIPPNSKNYNIFKSLEACENLELALDLISNNFELNFFNPEVLSEKIHIYFSTLFGEETTKIFNLFHRKPKSKRSRSLSTFEQIVHIDEILDDSKNKVLRINNKALNTLISLGKIDNVIDAIKNKFIENIDKSTTREKLNFPIQDKTSLAEVVAWYNNVKTELCPTITDCPPLVASILEFDFKNKIGIFDSNYGVVISINKTTLFAKDGYLLVTGLIRRFLFKKGRIENLFFPNYKNSDIKLSIPDYINNLYDNKYNEPRLEGEIDQLDDLNNTLMKGWANIVFNDKSLEESKEYEAMINRFKKLPIYLKQPKVPEDHQPKVLEDQPKKPHKRRKQGIWSMEYLIRMQKERSLKKSYPIDSSFPLPLWVDVNFLGDGSEN